MGKLINPATGKPFVEVRPNDQIIRLRHEIMRRFNPNNRYDAAQTTSQNELHWTQSDELSPNSANSLAVRKKLRSRSRYEVANNGYLRGILLSLAGDFVGSGPTLQITDERFNEEQRGRIENQWLRRAKKIKLRRKLWRLRMAKCQDGEAFGIAYNAKRLMHPVRLDYRIVECDQISTFDGGRLVPGQPVEVDGVRYDVENGEPLAYYVLYQHPGESYVYNFKASPGSWVHADQVIHWFRQDRGWIRGIPETAATLPLWALLRRYTLAVVQNAEIAADFTVLLKSILPPYTTAFPLSGSPGEPTEANPNDWFASFPVDRGMMTVLPSSYEMSQLDPAQPVTMYDTFVNALVQEATRPLLCPRNLALGNSGGYNMASGTLDRQMYRQAINEERQDCNSEVLDKDFENWWYEAIRESDYFEDDFGTSPISRIIQEYPSLRYDAPDHLYRWDEIPEHTDPLKVAQAIDVLYRGGHISDTDIQEGRFNRRVEDHYRNLEKQINWREENWFEEPTEVLMESNQSSEEGEEGKDLAE